MKILAIEKENNEIDWDMQEETLKNEANAVYNLFQSGTLREFYFTHESEAILILECENKQKAREILDTLLLVKEGLIEFKIMELKPYPGFSRILKVN